MNSIYIIYKLMKGDLLDWLTQLEVRQFNNGCLKAGEAENQLAAQSKKLEAAEQANQ
jgi:hypothetical protein